MSTCAGCHIRIPAGERFCPWGCAEWAASKGDAKEYKRMCAETRATWADRDVE